MKIIMDTKPKFNEDKKYAELLKKLSIIKQPTNVNELSGGQACKVKLAQILAKHPEYEEVVQRTLDTFSK